MAKKRRGMTKRQTQLELANILQADAAEIIAARVKGRIIHHTQDIDAVGDEVEQTVRRVIRRKLPMNYYIGHGHLVDSKLSTSPQLDLIIADNTSTPILFQTQSSAEYFPFESVYAIGEIKATYYQSQQPIENFMKVLAQIRRQLKREQTPSPDSISSGIPFGNPLFSFMVFTSANNFFTDEEYHVIEQRVVQLYETTPPSDLPNLLCFLDTGVMMYTDHNTPGEKRPFFVNQPFLQLIEAKEGQKRGWAFTSFYDENSYGANLGLFCLLLNLHLKSCVLTLPDLSTYLRQVFSSPQFTSEIT